MFTINGIQRAVHEVLGFFKDCLREKAEMAFSLEEPPCGSTGVLHHVNILVYIKRMHL